jgi:hypothetical protein
MSKGTGRRAMSEKVSGRPASAGAENRVRAWVAAASIGMLLLALTGLFVLILLDVQSDLIALWLTALSTMAAFALAATNIKRSGSDGGPHR